MPKNSTTTCWPSSRRDSRRRRLAAFCRFWDRASLACTGIGLESGDELTHMHTVGLLGHPDHLPQCGWERPATAASRRRDGGAPPKEQSVPKMPWTPGPFREDTELHVLTSKLPLSRYRDVPRFLAAMLRDMAGES